MYKSHLNFLYNYKTIKEEIINIKKNINLLVVTKNQTFDKIKELINIGHCDFAENKVQEAYEKWSDVIKINKKIQLHLIGKLQSNKVKDAFSLFNFIHTLDNEKLANKFYEIEKNSLKKIKYFIQVNIGNEPQKNGISINHVSDFVKYCVDDLKLNIIGLMCIPPVEGNPLQYFKILTELASFNHLNELSMGMSNDYKCAIKNGATFVRIGSKIFSEN